MIMEEQVTREAADTALCIWEWFLDESQGTLYKTTWMGKMHGTSELRYHCIDLASEIEHACEELYTEFDGPAWSQPFDWEIIPAIMGRYCSQIDPDKQYDYDALRKHVRDVYLEDHKEL